LSQAVDIIAEDIAPAMAELLRAGAEDGLGLCCRPGQVKKNYAALSECEKLGLIRFIDVERPWITAEGRAAIGAPNESEATRAWLMRNWGGRKRLVPEKRNDPRTDFDYESYKAMKWVCTLVFRQPDPRVDP